MQHERRMVITYLRANELKQTSEIKDCNHEKTITAGDAVFCPGCMMYIRVGDWTMAHKQKVL